MLTYLIAPNNVTSFVLTKYMLLTRGDGLCWCDGSGVPILQTPNHRILVTLHQIAHTIHRDHKAYQISSAIVAFGGRALPHSYNRRPPYRRFRFESRSVTSSLRVRAPVVRSGFSFSRAISRSAKLKVMKILCRLWKTKRRSSWFLSNNEKIAMRVAGTIEKSISHFCFRHVGVDIHRNNKFDMRSWYGWFSSPPAATTT